MKKQTRKLTKFEVYGLIALGASIGFYFYVHKLYYPMKHKFASIIKKEQKLQKELSSLKWQLGDTEVYLKKLSQEKNVYKEIEPEYSRYKKVICTQDNIHQLLNGIHESLKKNNLSVKEFVPSENANDPVLGISRFVYEVELMGKYLNLIDFLQEIESLEYIVSIENLNIKTIENSNKLAINCRIKI